MAEQSKANGQQVTINYVSGELTTALFLVPVGAWKWFFHGFSEDALILTVAPPLLCFAVLIHWVALLKTFRWARSFIGMAVAWLCSSFEVFFLGYVVIAKSVMPMFRLLHNFSWLNLLAACFFFWTMLDPAKAIAIMTDSSLKRVERPVPEEVG